jgi:hypothetical protein
MWPMSDGDGRRVMRAKRLFCEKGILCDVKKLNAAELRAVLGQQSKASNSEQGRNWERGSDNQAGWRADQETQ